MGLDTNIFDGLSSAYSYTPYLETQLKAFTLFAIYCFELTTLAKTLPAVYNVYLTAEVHEEKIIFLNVLK